MGILNSLLFVVYCLALFLFFLWGINCYVLIFLQRRARDSMLRQDEEVWKAWQASNRELPRVTVQLPIYNECYVIQRLIDTVVRLNYPQDRLEIQILDDSTDETTALATSLMEHYRQEGFDITLHHRRQRTGYKAGALQEGLEVATGEFIALFDADFIPNADFLMRTLPFFQDPAIAVVQTRWGHINRDYSLLTLAQAFVLDAHIAVELAALCWSGLFLHFNGSAGIWRRQAINDAGGWQADTLSEDLDLSYRAQLRGWRIKILPQVVCPAEVPVQMSAFRTQQTRWAKGTFQLAKKLVPQIVRAELPLFTKYQAVLHLITYIVHPLMLFISLTVPPLSWFEGFHSIRNHFLAVAGVFFSVAAFGPLSFYPYAQIQIYHDWRRYFVYLPSLLIFQAGMALNNTKAILEALFNVQGAFVRTPKLKIAGHADTWVDKRYQAPFPWLSLFEALLALYYAYGIVLFVQRGMYFVDPFFILCTIGFASVSLLSLWEFLQISLRQREPTRTQHKTWREGKTVP
jgi:cellulose synthase/poly-beta-1,6-N-acetylglucosamine synthase-like glycosyltransferase